MSGWEYTFRISMAYVSWRSIRGLMVRRECSLAVAVCGRSGAWLFCDVCSFCIIEAKRPTCVIRGPSDGLMILRGSVQMIGKTEISDALRAYPRQWR